MSFRTRIFLACVILIGAVALAKGLLSGTPIKWLNFWVYLLVALLGSGLKVRLPGILGTMSIGFFFVLIGIVSLSLPEALVIACVAVLVQYFWRAACRLHLVQMLFNVASIAIAVTVAYPLFHSRQLQASLAGRLLLPWILGAVYFAANTLLVAGAIALSENRGVWTVWRSAFCWSLPYYLLGGAGAALFDMAQQQIGWQTAVLLLPLAYVAYRFYRLEVNQLHLANMSWGRS